MEQRFDSHAVAQHFSRAAGTYVQAAQLQQRIAEYLATLSLPYLPEEGSVLDLGCGPGVMAKLPAFQRRLFARHLIQCDLSRSMCRLAQEYAPAVCADVRALPLPDAGFHTVLSSLMLQWISETDVPHALDETARILQPGGVFAFSTFTEGTLRELAESFQAAGEPDGRVSRFVRREMLEAALRHAGFAVEHCHQETRRTSYETPMALLYTLRDTGATAAALSRPRGMLPRESLKKVVEYYQNRFRQESGMVIASWEVTYMIATRTMEGRKS